MIYIMAFVGFACFIVYDVSARSRSGGWAEKYAFRVGLMCWAASEAFIFFDSPAIAAMHRLRAACFFAAAAFFLLLLVYSLFFAIPFTGGASPANDGERRVCDTGVYALCRHPGVLWFIGMQASVYLALGGAHALAGGLTLSALDVTYAAFQDKWIFPFTFSDYDAYKQTTPFLIPSVASVKRCARSLRRKGARDEVR